MQKVEPLQENKKMDLKAIGVTIAVIIVAFIVYDKWVRGKVGT